MFKLRSIFLSLILLVVFLLPNLVLATETTESSRTNPQDNPLCWSKEFCEKDFNGDSKNDGIFNNTDYKAKETCGPTYGFCYPGSIDYELAVSLPIAGTVTRSVADLGDYVNKMYLFLLAISSIIAIVTLMASGIQYVTSPGGGEGVSKAKEKMKGALIGLVLLTSAALLLATVNPQLLNLSPPPTPKIRTIIYFGDDMMCEKLLIAGYKLDIDRSAYTTATCGLYSTVIENSSGVALSEAEKFKCVWTSCAAEHYIYPTSSDGSSAAFNVEKTCIADANGKGKCMSCEEVTTGPPFDSGIQPGVGGTNCSLLTPVFLHGGKPDGWNATCEFSYDLGFEVSEWLDSKNTGQCAVVAYDCNNIKTCNDYDAIHAWNNDGFQDLDAFEAPGWAFDYSVHRKICEGNLCNIAGGCHQDRSEKLEAAITGITALGLATVNPFSKTD